MSDSSARSPSPRPKERGRAHAPRPADLVALVTFDGEVYENQAVTRERLARPANAPHPLNAAIEQWLGRRRRTWIDVRGRQIDGIATARDLSSRRVWVIDTLVNASAAQDDDVVGALLRQAVGAAVGHRVTHILLRIAAEAPALSEALRAGFKPALSERLWSGPASQMLSCPRAEAPDVSVREVREQDAFALFQLYNRALPIDGRQALALTLEEWQHVQERRWLGRGRREYVAVNGSPGEDGARICAALRLAPGGDVAQFDLLADADGVNGAAALLDVAAEQLSGDGRVLALASHCAAPLEGLLRERGLEEGPEYALLSRRTTERSAERTLVAPGIAVSRGV